MDLVSIYYNHRILYLRKQKPKEVNCLAKITLLVNSRANIKSQAFCSWFGHLPTTEQLKQKQQTFMRV